MFRYVDDEVLAADKCDEIGDWFRDWVTNVTKHNQTVLSTPFGLIIMVYAEYLTGRYIYDHISGPNSIKNNEKWSAYILQTNKSVLVHELFRLAGRITAHPKAVKVVEKVRKKNPALYFCDEQIKNIEREDKEKLLRLIVKAYYKTLERNSKVYEL